MSEFKCYVFSMHLFRSFRRALLTFPHHPLFYTHLSSVICPLRLLNHNHLKLHPSHRSVFQLSSYVFNDLFSACLEMYSNYVPAKYLNKGPLKLRGESLYLPLVYVQMRVNRCVLMCRSAVRVCGLWTLVSRQ